MTSCANHLERPPVIVTCKGSKAWTRTLTGQNTPLHRPACCGCTRDPASACPGSPTKDRARAFRLQVAMLLISCVQKLQEKGRSASFYVPEIQNIGESILIRNRKWREASTIWQKEGSTAQLVLACSAPLACRSRSDSPLWVSDWPKRRERPWTVCGPSTGQDVGRGHGSLEGFCFGGLKPIKKLMMFDSLTMVLGL